LVVAWGLSEAALSVLNAANRLRGTQEAGEWLSFILVWSAVMVTLFVSVASWQPLAQRTNLGGMGALAPLLGYLGCACLAAGIGLRLAAAAVLRRQFTTMVTIVTQHRLIENGPYRWVRHPAYSGLLLSLLGLGLTSGNWVSLAVALALPPAAILYRIRVEERMLLRYFGPAYADYMRRTKRLAPGIY
jgi:protein-S-isoprenylcysteine O-methyltransferase Ste14